MFRQLKPLYPTRIFGKILPLPTHLDLAIAQYHNVSAPISSHSTQVIYKKTEDIVFSLESYFPPHSLWFLCIPKTLLLWFLDNNSLILLMKRCCWWFVVEHPSLPFYTCNMIPTPSPNFSGSILLNTSCLRNV